MRIPLGSIVLRAARFILRGIRGLSKPDGASEEGVPEGVDEMQPYWERSPRL